MRIRSYLRDVMTNADISDELAEKLGHGYTTPQHPIHYASHEFRNRLLTRVEPNRRDQAKKDLARVFDSLLAAWSQRNSDDDDLVEDSMETYEETLAMGREWCREYVR